MKDKQSQSSFAQIKSKIKVVFLGQQSTGKTSILTRFIHDKFEQGSGPTIGIDFMAKNIHIGTNILRFQLWDTAGQQRFRSLIPSYLKDALIAFIVFDLTNHRSFDNLNQWIDICHNNKNDKTIVVLLGNKSDLQKERQVQNQKIRQKLQQTSLPYFQVSAKTGQNIKQAFNFAGNQYFNAHLNTSELTLTVNGDRTIGGQQTHKVEKSINSIDKANTNINKQMERSNKNLSLKKSEKKQAKKKGCC